MSIRGMAFSIAVAITALGFLGAPAHAQATRTWVSGVGDDANPCSRTAPCKTFAGAISKTAPGGEIDALDPGGFGALTITKSITIDGGGGQVASVLVAGTNGIVVAAGASDVVILRNMRINGLLGGGNSNAGLSGIRFSSGAVLGIENCTIFGFNTAGIVGTVSSSAQMNIVNTTIQNATIGVEVLAGTNASLENVRILNNKTTGLTVNASTVMVRNATVTGNGIGLDIENGATANVDNSTVDHNVAGAFVSASTLQLSGSNVAFNGTLANGTIMSYSNNRFSNNGAGGTITAIGTANTNPSGQQ